MTGVTYATYGEQMVKAIIKTCEGGEEVCRDQTFKLGKIHRVKMIMKVKNPSKLDPDSISDIIFKGIEQIKQKYPNINIVYLEVNDPDGSKKNIELIMDMFDPPIASAGWVVTIIYVALIIAALLLAAGVVTGAYRFFVYMSSEPGKIIVEDFISTVGDITKAVIDASRHNVSEGGGESGGRNENRSNENSLAYGVLGIIIAGGVAYLGFKVLRRKK